MTVGEVKYLLEQFEQVIKSVKNKIKGSNAVAKSQDGGRTIHITPNGGGRQPTLAQVDVNTGKVTYNEHHSDSVHASQFKKIKDSLGASISSDSGADVFKEDKNGEKKQAEPPKFRYSDDKQSFQQSVSRIRRGYDVIKGALEDQDKQTLKMLGLTEKTAQQKVEKMKQWLAGAKKYSETFKKQSIDKA